MQDEDGYVRSYVCIGINRAISGECADGEFRRHAYDLLLNQCDQDWAGTLNDSAARLVMSDRDQAAVDFANERWLSGSNKSVWRIIEGM